MNRAPAFPVPIASQGFPRHAFPCADLTTTSQSLGLYRNHYRDAMKYWVDQELYDSDVSDTATVDRLAGVAERELARSLNTNERRLLGEVVRDLLTARTLVEDYERTQAAKLTVRNS